jgi:hypothetical protein
MDDHREEAAQSSLIAEIKRLNDQLDDALRERNAALDTSSSASRQHYIETGRYLTHGESMADRIRAVLNEAARNNQWSDALEAIDEIITDSGQEEQVR